LIYTAVADHLLKTSKNIMKQPFQLFMLAIMIASNIGCKKEKNQSKTIQLENLKWSKVSDGLSIN
jgi:hypothetical protein